MRTTYTINCLSECLSPLTHMSGTSGNEGIVAREPVHTDKGVLLIPFLSGNAIRHRCVREPGILWLIDRYELRGKLTLPQLNFLLHGGNLTQSTGSENTKRIADMHELLPLLRICGGSLSDQILSGSLDCWRGVLICEENRKTISQTIGHLPSSRLMSAERWIHTYQYTRGDAKKTGIAKDSDTNDDSNLMIFSGQCVGRGAMFHHGFVLKHATPLDLGALLMSLRLWQDSSNTIGGNARIGHGRLITRLIDFEDDDELIRDYISHVDSVKSRAIAWLNDAFTAKSELRDRTRKSKKGASHALESLGNT